MKPIHLLTCFSLSTILMASCSQADRPSRMVEQRPAPPALQVPDLPTRGTELGAPEEYDRLRDTYDNARLALKKKPADLASWLRIAEVFMTEARITGQFGANFEKALAVLDHVIERSSEDPAHRGEALALKATIKLSQHRFKEALDLGAQAVKLDPYRAYNYGVLVDANVELGNYAEAVKMSDHMVGTRPDLRSYSRVSYLREIHGDLPGAIEAMDQAVKAGYPGFEETEWCRVQLGKLHEDRGDLTAAREQYELANGYRKNYPMAMAALGRIALKQGKTEQAEQWLVKAIALMPDPHFYTELARVHGATGQTQARAEALAQAERLLIGLSGTANAHTHSHGGDLHSHEHAGEGDPMHAHPASDHGHSHEVGLEMGRFELEFHNDLDAALANAMHEHALRPDNIEVNALLAAVHYARGDLANARAHLALAQRTGSTDPKLRCLAGLIAIAAGERSSGKALIAAALKDDPHQNHHLVAAARRAI